MAIATISARKTKLPIEDTKNTLTWDFFMEQPEDGYEEYFHNKVSDSLSTYHIGKNPTTPHQKAMASTRKKIFA